MRYRSPTVYLALGGVYHPDSGCTLKQPDSVTITLCRSKSDLLIPLLESVPTGLSPSMVCLSRHIGTVETALDLGYVMRPQFLTIRLSSLNKFKKDDYKDFRLGLFPVHSPLLRESRLFSFPPLIKMLQFSG